MATFPEPAASYVMSRHEAVVCLNCRCGASVARDGGGIERGRASSVEVDKPAGTGSDLVALEGALRAHRVPGASAHVWRHCVLKGPYLYVYSWPKKQLKAVLPLKGAVISCQGGDERFSITTKDGRVRVFLCARQGVCCAGFRV